MSPAPIPDQERQHAVACRKFFLIGIATIVIYAVFYAFLKSYSDSETNETEIRVQSSWVDPANVNPGLTQPMFFLFIFVGFCVSFIACAACATWCANVMWDGKEVVEAERVLQELRRDTKSDMSLAIPKALP